MDDNIDNARVRNCRLQPTQAALSI